MNKIIDIIKAWMKTFKHTTEQNDLANHRRSICNSCPHKSELNTCNECGCPLIAKVYSDFGCPIDKW